MTRTSPNYKRIYSDILERNFPEKKDAFAFFLSKRSLSSLDIIKLNDMIFGEAQSAPVPNKRFRSYNKHSILEILDYQKKNRLNNTQLSLKLGLSRNTVSKWKKIYCKDIL
ncbi:hypothetical protein MUU74_08050 [Chryseobacterium daecheongense]|uniref:helix-turn-helix domain-containing protein n=1 Tax=Chryseobacterium daecheongense TaxID=192389 RepID=UPI001FD6CEA0|nr:helix-turn-helix domain-containing protein [Chryseobacterium daecheongense]UOU99893.1 hypothetical protein MUU74_08050 [Chryseobacterium daecheongense]